MKFLKIFILFVLVISIACTNLNFVSAISNDNKINSDEVPDIIGYEEAITKGHKKRLYDEEHELNTVVFQNNDESNTIYMHKFPVKYVDSEGNIKDKTKEIVKFENGFKSVDNDIVSVFGENAKEGTTLSYQDVNINIGYLSNEEKYAHSKASLVNDIVKYKIEPGVVLESSLTYMGIKESVVVKKNADKNSFNFIVNTNGLFLTKGENEEIYFVDKYGNKKAYIGEVLVRSKDEKHNSFANITISTITESELYELTINITDDYYQNDNVNFPVEIETTIEIVSSSNERSIPDIQDATINSTGGTDGSSGSLYIGKRANYGVSRILMSFPGLDLSIIDDVSQIASAHIEMRDLMCQESAMTISCHTFTGNDWDESTVTWSNANPNSYVSSALSSKSISYDSGATLDPVHRYSFDITDAVIGWKSGTYSQSKGVIFKPNSSVENGSTYISKTFASFNRSEYQPSLTLTYYPLTKTLDSGYYRIKSVYSNKYLTVSGHNVMQYDEIPGSAIQKWKVVYAGTAIGTGYYYIMPCIDLSHCLDIYNAWDSNGTNVQIHDGNGSNAQLFRIIACDTGYRICPKSSSTRALDVCGPSTENRANIQLWTYVNVPQQQWVFESVEYSPVIYHTLSTPIDDVNTQDTPDPSDDIYNQCEDLMCGDKTLSDLLSIGVPQTIIDKSASEQRDDLESLVSWTSRSPLQGVAFDMVNNMMNGTGNYFSNSTLTSEVMAHDNTVYYCDEFISRTKTTLSSCNGNKESLNYFRDTRNTLPLINSLSNPTLNQPYYEEFTQGLGITIHSWQSSSVELKSFTSNGNNYSGVLTFKFWDVFGLDALDLEKYPTELVPWFESWYILQHYSSYNKQYKPFITYVEFDMEFSGTL